MESVTVTLPVVKGFQHFDSVQPGPIYSKNAAKPREARPRRDDIRQLRRYREEIV
jgi:hypothetical protein